MTQGHSCLVGREGKPRGSSVSLWAQLEADRASVTLGLTGNSAGASPALTFLLVSATLAMTKIFHLCPTFRIDILNYIYRENLHGVLVIHCMPLSETWLLLLYSIYSRRIHMGS